VGTVLEMDGMGWDDGMGWGVCGWDWCVDGWVGRWVNEGLAVLRTDCTTTLTPN
jgi:hypothetical protein